MICHMSDQKFVHQLSDLNIIIQLMLSVVMDRNRYLNRNQNRNWNYFLFDKRALFNSWLDRALATKSEFKLKMRHLYTYRSFFLLKTKNGRIF
jgi:hypothetical protein